MKNRVATLIIQDRKLRTLFTGMISTGLAFLGLVILTGVFYL